MSVVELIINCSSFAFAVIMLVIGIINAVKNGNTLGVKKLLLMIPELISEAELTFGPGNGDRKKRYVMQELKINALSNGIKLSTEELDAFINNCVTSGNSLNKSDNTKSNIQ